MSAPHFEAALARLYTDAVFLESFLQSPLESLRAFELTDTEREQLAGIDRAGLQLAARSFRAKRAKRAGVITRLTRRLRKAVF